MKKRLFTIAALVGWPVFGFAQSPYPSPMIYADNANGERQIMGRTAARNGQQIWDRAVYATPTGQVQVTGVGQLPNPAGGNVATTVRANIPPAAVGAAAGRVAGALFKSLGPIGVGIAIYDLAKELGFTLGRDASGAQTVTKSDPPSPTGFYYRITQSCGTFQGPYAVYTSKPAACSGWFPQCQAGVNDTTSSAVVVGDNCVVNGNSFIPILLVDQPVVVATPSNLDELTAAIAAKSGWPVGSAIGRVMGEDAQPELHAPTAIIASGPASSPGPVSTTSDTTNNTTNVQTTTYNHNYSGDKITTTTNVTNITTNNTTGAVISSTTTNSTPAITPATAPTAPVPPVPPVETCGLPGKPACKIDETGTAPNAGTTYDATKTAIDTAKSSAETNIGGAASIGAPSWSFAFQLPTGCAPYVTGIKGVVLNVCQYQSTIHGLLSVIWAAATAFAMIGMVGRTIRES